MIFKEPMFLANCDSVRGLPPAELEKRFLLGVTFAGGIIVTPSLLLDNFGFAAVLERPNLVRWYNEDGSGGLILRAPGAQAVDSLRAYFDALPDSYIVTRAGGKRKGALDRAEREAIRAQLARLDTALAGLAPRGETVQLQPGALSEAITAGAGLTRWPAATTAHDPAALRTALDGLGARAPQLTSRSAWYHASAEALPADLVAPFRLEVIDAAYHGLFVRKGEAVSMDRIAALGHLPPPILDAAISIRALRKERELIGFAVKGVDLITSLGAGELARFLLDEAASYVEDKLTDKGLGWASRRNWFGLYPVLARKMGVEIKR